MVKFKGFSRPWSVFQVLFKAKLIFKDFSRQFCIFKYFSSLCKPWIFCLFFLFDSLHPINNLSVKQGRVFLGWTSTKLGEMCLAQEPQHSDAGEARTRGPSVSSQALYHWATALPRTLNMDCYLRFMASYVNHEQQRLRQAWAKIQFHQHFHCLHKEEL